MQPTLIGITGNWGIPEDETGVLIIDLNFEYSIQEKTVLDKGGEVVGLSHYQPKIEIKFSGYVKKTDGFSAKISSALVLANDIPDHLATSGGGTTIITGISRSLANEDFEKIDVNATHYPFVTHIP